jgi:hypothetical protein
LSSSILEDSDGSEPAVEDALRCNLVVTAKGIPRDRAVERERGNVLLEIQHGAVAAFFAMLTILSICEWVTCDH